MGVFVRNVNGRHERRRTAGTCECAGSGEQERTDRGATPVEMQVEVVDPTGQAPSVLAFTVPGDTGRAGAPGSRFEAPDPPPGGIVHVESSRAFPRRPERRPLEAIAGTQWIGPTQCRHKRAIRGRPVRRRRGARRPLAPVRRQGPTAQPPRADSATPTMGRFVQLSYAGGSGMQVDIAGGQVAEKRVCTNVAFDAKLVG